MFVSLPIDQSQPSAQSLPKLLSLKASKVENDKSLQKLHSLQAFHAQSCLDSKTFTLIRGVINDQYLFLSCPTTYNIALLSQNSLIRLSQFAVNSKYVKLTLKVNSTRVYVDVCVSVVYVDTLMLILLLSIR